MALTLIASLPLQAKVRLSKTVPVKIPPLLARQNTFNDQLQKSVPRNLSESQKTNANLVAQKMGDNLVNDWLQSPEIQASTLGRTASVVQSAVKTEVNLGQPVKNKTNHKVSFQVKAIEAKAEMEYKGWVNANVNYDARARQSVVSVSEKIGGNKDFVLSHTQKTDQDISSVGVRWNW